MIQPRLVGIAGGSGAGKSWFAAAIAGRLPIGEALVLAEDDYYHDHANRPGFDAARVNFDEPAALDHALLARHLKALRAGQSIEAPVYDFARHGRTGKRWLAPQRLILVEGLLILTDPAVRACLDQSIFLDLGEGRRLARRLARDTAERDRMEDEVRAQFAATVAPMHERWVAPSAAYASDIVRLCGDAEADRPLLAAAIARVLNAA